jgi:hypothetical protein
VPSVRTAVIVALGVAVALTLTGAPKAHAGSANPRSTRAPNHLSAPATLKPGEKLKSREAGFTLTMQRDGLLVVRAKNGQAEWSSGTSTRGSHAVLLNGGALLVRSPDGRTLWSSHSGGRAARPYRLVMRSTGALSILSSGHPAIWGNNLGSRCTRRLPSQAILVNITLQHLWACHHAHLYLSTPVTTGAFERGWFTPTGTWHVYAKERDVNLVGPSWDDHVKYWMPFHGPFGMHDASWQTFPEGSPKYKSKGSHGCVHLPLLEMKVIYRWAKIGARVTVSR